MMMQVCGKMLADTGVMDDAILPKVQLPFADTVAKTCSAVKGKFNRSMPLLKESAAMAGLSLVLTSGGALLLTRGITPASEASLYAIGIGVLLAAGSAQSFWQAIKA